MAEHIWSWQNPSNIGRRPYVCGFCGDKVGPDRGYFAASNTASGHAYVFICPSCTLPTFINVDGSQTPAVRLGKDVKGISDAGVQALYNEARDCTSAGAYTGAVLLCRKILMNVAVQHGAAEGQTFIAYVDHLEKSGFVPPNGKEWVDQIRKKGNEATHEIKVMTEPECTQILHFVEMLLRFVYEFPSLLEKPAG